MIGRLKYVGCRVQCYIAGRPYLGFSVSFYGMVRPSRGKMLLWNSKKFPLSWLPSFVKVVEMKYHFEITERSREIPNGKLVSFSVPPNRSNTISTYEWIKTLDGKMVEIHNINETGYNISYYDEEYYGELYPEDESKKPAFRSYMSEVTILED